MTATRTFILPLTAAIVALAGVSGLAGAGASDVRLRAITQRATGSGSSLVLEATQPVAYVATRPDPLTLLVDLRNVASSGAANRVAAAPAGPIAAVTLEETLSMGAPVSRVKIALKQAVDYHVRSARNTIIVDFDAPSASAAPTAAPPAAGSQARAVDAMQALASTPAAQASPLLAVSVPASVLPAGSAALMALATAIPQAPTLPATGGAAVTPQEPQRRFTGATANFNLEDADLLGTLRLIQDISGLNMVIDPGITGKVNLVLNQVPWDQALDVVLKQNKLGYVVEDTIVRIAPLSVLADEQTQRRKLADEQALAGQLVTFPKTLSYAKVDEMQPLIRDLLSSRGTVRMDARTNTVIVTDLQDRINTVTDLIQTLDRPQPQVEIEARIVETSKVYSRQLGIQWGFQGNVSPALGNTTGLAFPNNGSLGGRLGSTTGPAGGPQTPSAVDLGVPATSSVGLALGSINGAFNLDAQLSALESSGHGTILSTPRVSTLNNVEAEMTQGVQIPIQTISNNTVTVSFQDAALKLKVTPQITAADTVIMKVALENSQPDFARAAGPASVPPINTQRALTTLLVNDGQTTVIGGIYTSNQQKTTDSTPGLGDIPLIKWLFRRDRVNDDSKELLIFITPRIIR